MEQNRVAEYCKALQAMYIDTDAAARSAADKWLIQFQDVRMSEEATQMHILIHTDASKYKHWKW